MSFPLQQFGPQAPQESAQPALAWLGLDGRYKRIAAAMLSGAAARVLSSLVAFVSLPLAVRYLGAERYGVWATITSIAVWLNLLDLGIANSLTNLIARAYASGRRTDAARAFTSALALTFAIAALSAAVFLFCLARVNWATFFHAELRLSEEIRWTVLIAGLLVLAALPLNLVSKVLAGYQEVHRWNQAQGWAALLSLGGMGIGVVCKVSMPVLYLLSFGSIACVGCVMLLRLLWRKPWLAPHTRHVHRGTLVELLSAGWSFLLIQIAAAVVFSSDNLVISHYLGASEVTPYSVTWRLIAFGAVLQSLAFPALWPAYAEAQARGDVAWIRRTYSTTMKATLALNLAFAVCVLILGRSAIRYWAGPSAVPPYLLLLAMTFWSVLSGCMTVQSCLLAALNRTRLQAILSVIAAALNIILSIFLVTRIGSLGVILATISSYVLVLVVPQTMTVDSALRQLAGTRGETRNARVAEASECVV